MKKLMGLAVVMAAVALAGVALAAPPGWGARMGGGPMMGARGPGWGAGGAGGCPMAGFAGPGAAAADPAALVTEDKAKELATEYVAKYMTGYTIERVLPFAGRFHTAYQVELKGPKGETRTLHVNPWGAVRPFGGPLASND
jgi:hypothetical protein